MTIISSYTNPRSDFNNIIELLEQTKRISLWNYSGVFKSKVDYLECFSVLNQCSSEEGSFRNFALKEIFPLLKSKKSMLDVGVGNGWLTHYFSTFFTDLTLVDTSIEALNDVNFLNHNVNKIHQSILDVDLGSNKFDLILLSHVLYYFSNDEISMLIKRLHNHLNPNGLMIVVVSEGQGKQQIIEHFGGQALNLEPVIKHSVEFTEKVSFYQTQEFIYTPASQILLAALNIFLNDSNLKIETSKVIYYINKFCRMNNQLYGINFLQKSFVVRK